MTKQQTSSVRIYPVPGHFILGVPALEQEVATATAGGLVETGAFSYAPEPAASPPEPAASPPEPTPESTVADAAPSTQED